MVTSMVVHVAVLGALGGQDGPRAAPAERVRHLVRSVSMDVPPMKREKPTPPEPIVEPPKPEPPPQVVKQAPPKKKIRRKARKRSRSKQVSTTDSKPALQPAAPPSAPTIAKGAGSMQVAMQASDEVVVAKADAPPTPPQPAPQVDLTGYGDGLHHELLRHRRYPEEAQDLELEGEVTVLIKLRKDGSLACAPRIAKTSGHKCLDNEALRMVKAAAPFEALPTGYTDDTAEFTIPVRFELDEDEF